MEIKYAFKRQVETSGAIHTPAYFKSKWNRWVFVGDVHTIMVYDTIISFHLTENLNMGDIMEDSVKCTEADFIQAVSRVAPQFKSTLEYIYGKSNIQEDHD